MAQINEVINGRYEILREIARGGMSIVYLAMDKRLNKQWAVKEFRKNEQNEEYQIYFESILHGANKMKALNNPAILPRISEIIDNDEAIYIIMEYIEGEPLSHLLDAYGAQPQEAVIEWAKQLSEAMDYLHTQNPPVIYVDLAPSNIMLENGNKIHMVSMIKPTGDGVICLGTRGYAAPELFGDSQTDARSDIYSFGMTLYHLLTGKSPAEPPYEIYPIRHWNSALSGGLEWLILKCTRLSPKDRFQSFAEVTYVLENIKKPVIVLKAKYNIRKDVPRLYRRRVPPFSFQRRDIIPR